MPIMRKLGLSIFFLILAGCASPTISTKYSGLDAGHLVIGMGASAGTKYSAYTFLFRKSDQLTTDKQARELGRISYYQDNFFWGKSPDYETANEKGNVFVYSLPSGKYEIYNFDIFYNGGTFETHFFANADFSIPFEITAGGVTYLGNYQANKIVGRNVFGMAIPGGAYFSVSDRLVNDIKFADKYFSKSNLLSLSSVKNFSPDVKKIKSVFFVENK